MYSKNLGFKLLSKYVVGVDKLEQKNHAVENNKIHCFKFTVYIQNFGKDMYFGLQAYCTLTIVL
jgi:hypothetical protein